MNGRPCVLVVDDQPLNLEIARILLEHDGFEVCTALDAQAALAMWRQQLPQIVLIDIQMPGQDGISLAQQLRADPRGAKVSLIAFTAYAMKGDRERLLAAGLDGYIAKPIDAGRFAREVRSLLEGAASPSPP